MRIESVTRKNVFVTGYMGGHVQRPMKESQENQQNAETQRERYYATIHKVALQQAANTGGGPDKIPGELFCYDNTDNFQELLDLLLRKGNPFSNAARRMRLMTKCLFSLYFVLYRMRRKRIDE